METQEQSEKQNIYEQKPWLFKPGQSGNPGGRPKGSKSLKTYAREYLESLSDDEKLEYIAGMDKKDIWEMAEGKAKQDMDTHIDGNLTINWQNEHNNTLQSEEADAGVSQQ